MNHKQTARQEVGGGYLWSPKFERGSTGPKRSQFYDNMRDASPGDLVISYADGAIRWIGRVTDFAFTAPKPSEFGTMGSYWSETGWRLPVAWTPLAQPVRPKARLEQFASLLPAKYSPINSKTGNGNQKAYLAEISQEVFEAVLMGLELDEAFLQAPRPNRSPFEEYVDGVEDGLEALIWEDPDLDSTTKANVILARRGQGLFRSRVQASEPRCRVTGVDTPGLLIASHIKPWRFCESAFERLDGANGLMLTPDADLLFDRGLITFEDDGNMRLSNRIDPYDLTRLGIPTELNAGEFSAPQRRYLGFHRNEMFAT